MSNIDIQEKPALSHPHRFRPQRPRRALKAQRQSRPGVVLDSIPDHVRGLYHFASLRETDLSYTNPLRRRPGGFPQRRHKLPSEAQALDLGTEPVSLYTILSRYLQAACVAPGSKSEPILSRLEISLLESKGYSTKNVEQWAASILSKSAMDAVTIFKNRVETPPLFIVLLFLRRTRIQASALHIVIYHLSERLQEEHITWASLQLLCTRLLRHARLLQPELIPWIASLYSSHAMRIYKTAKDKNSSPRMLSHLTYFSNTMLRLISLPASLRPMLASRHQEKAQFRVLRFMASCSPPLAVQRVGFRAIVNNQLLHTKTSQELEWATLKGPSWPPWKENRTAMDEEKGYDFGASRASRILHSMHEAGYQRQIWEDVAQLYAGWDTDLSPTIQTRTMLPSQRCERAEEEKVKPLLWAGRIRATRTRREAWACFLAHEASDNPPTPEVYFAMSEKLHYPEAQQQPSGAQSMHSDLEKSSMRPLLPGDMKEVQPEPRSPLHLVHLSEPLPTYEQLYHRMVAKGVQPTHRFLAFLVETLPDFSLVLDLLEDCREHFNGGIKKLVHGSLSKQQSPVPDYFFGSFIRFLCRFGRFDGDLPATTAINSLRNHEHRLRWDQSYLLKYAYALLMHCRPAYRPAFTAYMQQILFGAHKQGSPSIATKQYTIMRKLLEEMIKIGLHPDDDQLRLLCTAVLYVVRSMLKGRVPMDDAQHIVSTAPHLLRTVFQSSVVVNAHLNSPSLDEKENLLPPHVPDPATLHAYVRALGILRDYEGLYSFSTWITTHHVEVTSRAKAQRSGSRALFITFVALRAVLEGKLEGGQDSGPRELIELVKAQIDAVDEWEWPTDDQVDSYLIERCRSNMLETKS